MTLTDTALCSVRAGKWERRSTERGLGEEGTSEYVVVEMVMVVVVQVESGVMGTPMRDDWRDIAK